MLLGAHPCFLGHCVQDNWLLQCFIDVNTKNILIVMLHSFVPVKYLIVQFFVIWLFVRGTFDCLIREIIARFEGSCYKMDFLTPLIRHRMRHTFVWRHLALASFEGMCPVSTLCWRQSIIMKALCPSFLSVRCGTKTRWHGWGCQIRK